LINVVTNRFTHGIVLFISDRALKEMEDLGSSLRDKLADKDRVIASLKATLATMTEDKDRMLDGRDVDAVKAEQLIRKCNALDQQVAQYKASYAALESNLQEAHANLVTTQNNCAALEKRIAAMREENLDVKKKLGMKAAEVSGAAEDLRLLTAENQAVTAELADTVAERDSLFMRIQQLSQAIADMDQSKRALEIERTDLLTAYKTALQEKRQLEADIQNMG
jgi:chromosome segregation ATPase